MWSLGMCADAVPADDGRDPACANSSPHSQHWAGADVAFISCVCAHNGAAVLHEQSGLMVDISKHAVSSP